MAAINQTVLIKDDIREPSTVVNSMSKIARRPPHRHTNKALRTRCQSLNQACLRTP